MKDKLLIYGCNGYTGTLISRLAKKQGLTPILSGRNAESVKKLADELSFPYVAFDLADNAAADSALKDVKVVLHCAGPFMYTSRQMIQACLRNKAHYLDITVNWHLPPSTVWQSPTGPPSAASSRTWIPPGPGAPLA